MKLNKKILFVFIVLIIISPFQQYSKWHLRTFSDGIVYSLLNVTFIPHDYKRIIWSGGLNNKEALNVELSHKYKGLYGIYVAGDVVKNKGLKYTVSINCESGELLKLNFKDVLATDLFRETHNEVLLGSYNVTNTSRSFKKCSIEFRPANFDREVFLTIIKKTHW
jgi:hypothetical protein